MTASAASPSGQASSSLVDDGERIVERRHEDAADGVDDQSALALFGVDQRGAAAGRGPGKFAGRISLGARSMYISASR